jgi:hypothetical protein
MGQFSVNTSDQLISDLDRVASARGLSRPDLMRQVITEIVEAHDAGRLAFTLDDGPRLDTSLNTLAVQLREAVVEIDRSQRENQKLTKRLIDSWNGGEEAARDALQKLSDHLNGRFRDGFEPFRDRVNDVLGEVKAVPELVNTGLKGLARSSMQSANRRSSRARQTICI